MAEPQPQLQPQPQPQGIIANNIAVISENFTEIGEELSEIHQELENLPMNQQEQVNNQIAQLQEQVAQLQAQSAQMNERFQNLEEMSLIRLYNVNLHLWMPLKYPAGIDVEPPVPRTKAELLALSRANCIAVANTLGLPGLQGPTLTQCRHQIANYLGCTDLFEWR